MLIQAASLLKYKPAYRLWLFLGAACISVLLIGYHFGTFDQFAHIPFLKAYADPTLYPQDPFLTLREQNYSYFWRILAQVYRIDLALGNPEPWVLGTVMFLVHLAVTTLFFWMIWELSLELFGKPEAALLSVIAFIFPHISFGGFPVLEFSLLNRTFVLPFLLLAILLYLRGHRYWAFLLLGLLFNLHVLTVNFVIAMFGFDSLLRLRSLGGRRTLIEGLLLLSAAAPTLVWKLTTPQNTPLVDPAWFDLVARGFLGHLFYLVAPYLHVVGASIAGFSTLALYLFARWRQPATRYQPIIDHFILAVVIILAIQIMASLALPITLIIQLQIVRAGMFVTILGYLYFVHYLFTRLVQRPAEKGENTWQLGILIATPFAFLVFIAAALQRWVRSPRLQGPLLTLCLALSATAIFLLNTQLHLWDPTLHPWGRHNTWYDAQVWARQNTPKEALFITPPQKWGIYDSDWRVFSERGTVVEHADLLMVALAPDYTGTWLERFERLAPGAAQQFNGNYFDNVQFVQQAYYRLTEADLRQVAADYGASYLVMEKPHQCEFPIVYQNADFIIYQLAP